MGARTQNPDRQSTGNRNCSADVGAMAADHFPDDTALLADCFPSTQESYGAFASDGKKLESRDKQPYGLDRFIRADKQNVVFSGFATDPGANLSGWLRWMRWNDYVNLIPICSRCKL